MSKYVDDPLLRPYGQSMMEHDYTIASIMLFPSPDKSSPSDGSTKSGEEPNENEKVSIAIPISTLNKEGKQVETLYLNGDNTIPYYAMFNNFCLLNFQESSEEIVKMHVNFSHHWNLFMFGEQPKIYTFSGVFLDSKEYPFYQEFMVAYEKYLRGYKCVENKMEMYISYAGRYASGYLMGVSTGGTGENDMLKSFNFNIIVKDSNWDRDNYRMDKFSSSDGDMVNYQNATTSRNYLSNVYRFKGISVPDQRESGTSIGNQDSQVSITPSGPRYGTRFTR